MTTKSALLTATFAFALTAGAAHAQSSQYAFGSARSAYPAAVAHGSAPNALAIPGSSAAPLSVLLRDWDRAGFSAPSKPAQARVYGRNGITASGGEYHTMVSLIRSAIKDSAEGRDQNAMGKIARVRTLLLQ